MSRLIPRGAVVAGLGKRFLAALVDALPITVISGVAVLVLGLTTSPAIRLVAIIGACVLGAGYALYQWWAYATRGAGIGARVTGLRLVSMRDGEPIGWWRFFLRQVVFYALMATGIGGIALLIFLVIHERRQGWHDMVGGAVMVEPKRTEAKAPTPQKKAVASSTVGLPPHLASSFSPQPGTSSSAGSAPAPDWLPGIQPEPVLPAAQAQFPQPQSSGQQFSPQSQSSAQQWNSQPPAQPGQQWGGQQAGPSWPGQQPKPAQPQQPQAPQWKAPEQPWQQQAPEAQGPASPPKPAQNWIPLPSASSVIEPSRKVRVRPRDFGEVDDDEGTRIANLPAAGASRPGDEGWYIRLDDGREVELSVTVLLGRNPHKTAEDPEEVHLVPASGDGRMISRTHVMIGTDPRGVYVVDRGSTNGTALVAAGGELEPCPSGTQVRVREGQQVSYGNRWFTVLRRPAL